MAGLVLSAIVGAAGRRSRAGSTGQAVRAARPAQVGAAAPVISVLSSRADLISGGEALVSVALPPGTDPGRCRCASAHAT